MNYSGAHINFSNLFRNTENKSNPKRNGDIELELFFNRETKLELPEDDINLDQNCLESSSTVYDFFSKVLSRCCDVEQDEIKQYLLNFSFFYKSVIIEQKFSIETIYTWIQLIYKNKSLLSTLLIREDKVLPAVTLITSFLFIEESEIISMTLLLLQDLYSLLYIENANKTLYKWICVPTDNHLPINKRIIDIYKTRKDIKNNVEIFMYNAYRFDLFETITNTIPKYIINYQENMELVLYIINADIKNENLMKIFKYYKPHIPQDKYKCQDTVVLLYIEILRLYEINNNSDEEFANNILQDIKKMCRIKLFDLNIVSLSSLFTLLRRWIDSNSTFTQSLYLFLILQLFENYNKEYVYSFISYNILNLIQLYPNNIETFINSFCNFILKCDISYKDITVLYMLSLNILFPFHLVPLFISVIQNFLFKNDIYDLIALKMIFNLLKIKGSFEALKDLIYFIFKRLKEELMKAHGNPVLIEKIFSLIKKLLNIDNSKFNKVIHDLLSSLNIPSIYSKDLTKKFPDLIIKSKNELDDVNKVKGIVSVQLPMVINIKSKSPRSNSPISLFIPRSPLISQKPSSSPSKLHYRKRDIDIAIARDFLAKFKVCLVNVFNECIKAIKSDHFTIISWIHFLFYYEFIPVYASKYNGMKSFVYEVGVVIKYEDFEILIYELSLNSNYKGLTLVNKLMGILYFITRKHCLRIDQDKSYLRNWFNCANKYLSNTSLNEEQDIFIFYGLIKKKIVKSELILNKTNENKSISCIPTMYLDDEIAPRKSETFVFPNIAKKEYFEIERASLDLYSELKLLNNQDDFKKGIIELNNNARINQTNIPNIFKLNNLRYKTDTEIRSDPDINLTKAKIITMFSKTFQYIYRYYSINENVETGENPTFETISKKYDSLNTLGLSGWLKFLSTNSIDFNIIKRNDSIKIYKHIQSKTKTTGLEFVDFISLFNLLIKEGNWKGKDILEKTINCISQIFKSTIKSNDRNKLGLECFIEEINSIFKKDEFLSIINLLLKAYPNCFIFGLTREIVIEENYIYYIISEDTIRLFEELTKDLEILHSTTYYESKITETDLNMKIENKINLILKNGIQEELCDHYLSNNFIYPI